MKPSTRVIGIYHIPKGRTTYGLRKGVWSIVYLLNGKRRSKSFSYPRERTEEKALEKVAAIRETVFKISRRES